MIRPSDSNAITTNSKADAPGSMPQRPPLRLPRTHLTKHGAARLAGLAGLIGLGAAVPTARQDPEGDPPPTLEGFAESVAYDLGQQIALLRGPFEEIIAAIDGLEGLPGRTTMDARRRSLLDLGPAAIPLMVPYVDPAHPRGLEGAPGPGRQGRAEIVGEALAEAASVAATDPLLAVATTGSRRGRILALKALRTTPDTRMKSQA